MGILLIYTLKSAFCLTLLYLLYKWALADETFFRLNRGLLLAFWPLALLLPAIPLLLGKEAIATAALPGNELETVNTLMTTHEPQGKSLEQLYGLWLPMTCVVYLAGVIAVSAKIFIAYLQLRHLIGSGRQIGQGAFHLVLVKNKLAPFSWMRYIVISEKDYRDYPKEILAHELAHIRHHHSWDLILADAFIAWQWFNPAAWLLKREMRAVHEYEADDAVLSAGIEARSYQMLLIKKAVGSSRYTLANSFNHSTKVQSLGPGEVSLPRSLGGPVGGGDRPSRRRTCIRSPDNGQSYGFMGNVPRKRAGSNAPISRRRERVLSLYGHAPQIPGSGPRGGKGGVGRLHDHDRARWPSRTYPSHEKRRSGSRGGGDPRLAANARMGTGHARRETSRSACPLQRPVPVRRQPAGPQPGGASHRHRLSSG